MRFKGLWQRPIPAVVNKKEEIGKPNCRLDAALRPEGFFYPHRKAMANHVLAWNLAAEPRAKPR